MGDDKQNARNSKQQQNKSRRLNIYLSSIDQLDRNTHFLSSTQSFKMQFFSTIFAATALATLASAGSVHFVNQDSTQRTTIFTPNAGLESIPELVIAGSETANQTSQPAGLATGTPSLMESPTFQACSERSVSTALLAPPTSMSLPSSTQMTTTASR